MIKFLARYRHAITGIVVVLMITLFVYLAIQSKNLRISEYDNNTYPGLAFGTTVKKTIYMEGEDNREAVDKSIDELLKQLDERISYRNESSEIALCNRIYAVDGVSYLSSDIVDYLNREMDIYNETEGAFSPCILPLSKLWGIEDGSTIIPSESNINNALSYTDPSDMEVAESGVIFHKEGMSIDFGAVGKGIAADLVMNLLSDKQVPGAVVSIGGTIAVYGDKGKKKPWHIGIQDPRGANGDILGVLTVPGGSVVSTSGDYEKYFEVDGKRYHHIFDPKTGYPADNGLISVTICSEDGFLSDAMSTACFVLGLDKGMQYADEKGVDAIFVTSDKNVYTTKSLKKRFVLKADGYGIAN